MIIYTSKQTILPWKVHIYDVNNNLVSEFDCGVSPGTIALMLEVLRQLTVTLIFKIMIISISIYLEEKLIKLKVNQRQFIYIGKKILGK